MGYITKCTAPQSLTRREIAILTLPINTDLLLSVWSENQRL